METNSSFLKDDFFFLCSIVSLCEIDILDSNGGVPNE